MVADAPVSGTAEPRERNRPRESTVLCEPSELWLERPIAKAASNASTFPAHMKERAKLRVVLYVSERPEQAIEKGRPQRVAACGEGEGRFESRFEGCRCPKCTTERLRRQRGD